MLPQYTAHLVLKESSPATIRLRIGYLRRLAETADLETATFDNLSAFVRSNPSWSKNTRRAIIATFRSFYRWAKASGMRNDDPSLSLPNISIPRAAARIASDGTVLRALNGATVQDRAILRLGAECGLRVSEIACAHSNNRDGRRLSVHGKGDRTRTVYMSPELCELLDSLEAGQGSGYYFPGRVAEHIHPVTVWEHVRTLTGYNTHALRHRAGTVAYRRTGNDIRLAQTLLGHASPTTTAIYVHVEDDDLIRAAEATRLAA